MRQSVRAGFFPARRANDVSCVPSDGSSTQNAWLRYVAQSHGSAQTSPFRAGLRFRFQFAKYKTACRTGLALPFRLFCSDYKRAAFPMQRLRLTSTTTGKKSKDIRQRLFAHIGGSMVYCGQGFPAGQCHQLKTGAFVLCEKTAKQMQLVGAGLCSARQDTPNYRKSSANPYALTRLAVEADAHIGPAECTVFTGIYGEFVTSQWADRVVGPYNNPSHSLWGRTTLSARGMYRFYGNLRRIHSCPLHPKR